MNEILQLKGKMTPHPNTKKPGPANIPVRSYLSETKLTALCHELQSVISYWEQQKLGFTPLVSVQYIRVVAKSNRISKLFSWDRQPANEAIRGAKFSDTQNPKHIITYCLPLEAIKKALELLQTCTDIIKEIFHGTISAEQVDAVNKGKWKHVEKKLPKTTFTAVIKDAYYVEHFFIPSVGMPVKKATKAQLVTIYDTGSSYGDTVRKLGLQQEHFDKLDDTTWLLTPTQFDILFQKAPYLIAMNLKDMNDITPTFQTGEEKNWGQEIPKPDDEPIIGVIDTPFSKKAYFHDWVDDTCLLDPILVEPEDYFHGTAVSSLIVDGPALNPQLDDGCGRFRVRHFGVAKHGKTSSTWIINTISSIIRGNRDIKVWNLCLGSELETNAFSISPEAAFLDQLQYENDIIFVVSGTNNNNPHTHWPRIGSPADSLNSLVINSMTFDERPAEYARKGPVLCFFGKPDASAYGGDSLSGIFVYSTYGDHIIQAKGTSFAAPWVTRKLAYLIHILKFTKEEAKALLLDAAAGWKTNRDKQELLGFGRIPTSINDIIKTPEDEIKFVIHGVTQAYEMDAFNIPVPHPKGKYPYIAKATLCYFPKCSRTQGVDYTNTELDLHFGRLHDGKIKAIDDNEQANPEFLRLYEEDARAYYRKWDNVKHISEALKEHTKPKKMYEDSTTWGVCLRTKERLTTNDGKNLHFGLVITLKNINKENRIEEFIKLCEANNWFVQKVDVETMAEMYVAGEAEVTFEE